MAVKTKKLPKYHPDAYSGLATDYGNKFAADALSWRQENQPEQIDNATLHAGSPMYFYCRVCGWLSDVKGESYIIPPAKLCKECMAIKEENWLKPPKIESVKKNLQKIKKRRLTFSEVLSKVRKLNRTVEKWSISPRS